MSSFIELVGEVTGVVPGIPQPAAQKIVQQAFLDVRKERLWSWQVEIGEVYTADVINTGAVDVTQFELTVQFDTAARAVLDPLVVANILPALIPRQFRISGTGPIYTLSNYDDATGIGTLDRFYAEATAAGQGYAIYKCYYRPPFDDFLTYQSILDPINGYSISGNRLRGTQAEINRRDPMRGATGQPYNVFSYQKDTDGAEMHEWWPHPQTAQAYLCCCIRSGEGFLTNAEESPANLNAGLISQRALYYAFRWALAHSGTDPALKGIPWLSMMQEATTKYTRDLVIAKRDDNEIMLTNLVQWNAQLQNWLGPVDSNFWQSHDFPAGY